jgi:hypothetical protein
MVSGNNINYCVQILFSLSKEDIYLNKFTKLDLHQF